MHHFRFNICLEVGNDCPFAENVELELGNNILVPLVIVAARPREAKV